jgi:hypothetical protein
VQETADFFLLLLVLGHPVHVGGYAPESRLRGDGVSRFRTGYERRRSFEKHMFMGKTIDFRLACDTSVDTHNRLE